MIKLINEKMGDDLETPVTDANVDLAVALLIQGCELRWAAAVMLDNASSR